MISEPSECICLYSLKFKDDFCDLVLPLKIFINKFMEVRVEKFMEEESTWSTESSIISSISELEQIIYNHTNANILEIQEYIDSESIIEEELIPEEYETVEICDQECAKEILDPLKCQNCLITFKKELGLEQHMRTCQFPKVVIKEGRKEVKSSKSKTKCPYCSAVLLSDSLGRHIRVIHLKQKPHSCSICNRKFASASLRNTHQKTHERNVELQKYLTTQGERSFYQCPNCPDAQFHKSDQLKNHMEKNCYRPPKKRVYSYCCKFCPHLKFNTKILAAQHSLEFHNLRIKNLKKFCFECNDEFEDYTNHIRIHTCLFSCKYCSMKFLTANKCRSHEVSKHENEEEDRPFGCEKCSATFKSQHHLKSHLIAVHRSGKHKRNFSCELCGDKFFAKAILNAHLRTHDSDSIFVCKFCDKKFKKLSNLKIHSISIHQTDAIYMCNDCPRRFKYLQDLKSHCQKEHGINLNIQKYFHKLN